MNNEDLKTEVESLREALKKLSARVAWLEYMLASGEFSDDDSPNDLTDKVQ